MCNGDWLFVWFENKIHPFSLGEQQRKKVINISTRYSGAKNNVFYVRTIEVGLFGNRCQRLHRYSSLVKRNILWGIRKLFFFHLKQNIFRKLHQNKWKQKIQLPLLFFEILFRFLVFNTKCLVFSQTTEKGLWYILCRKVMWFICVRVVRYILFKKIFICFIFT